ncbi:MAG: hypothetical protein GSR79_05260 [Desulfurococcales archaeon]|nr:hypothetical protein [Desulfurococcales archaeon]
MVVIEEEFIDKHFRKIIIRTELENILKKDVYCNLPKSKAEKGNLILSEKMTGSVIEIFLLEINENIKGLALCVNNDCKLIDVLAKDKKIDHLEGFNC